VVLGGTADVAGLEDEAAVVFADDPDRFRPPVLLDAEPEDDVGLCVERVLSDVPSSASTAG
jgi:hypothetical protein